MAQELDFTDPEHMASSTMAAFALAQLSFSALAVGATLFRFFHSQPFCRSKSETVIRVGYFYSGSLSLRVLKLARW
jgi:hypothetical protein